MEGEQNISAIDETEYDEAGQEIVEPEVTHEESWEEELFATSDDEKINVANAMIKHGGSFVKQLGVMLLEADAINTIKIKKTWPDYWAQYVTVKTKLEE